MKLTPPKTKAGRNHSAPKPASDKEGKPHQAPAAGKSTASKDKSPHTSTGSAPGKST